MMQLEAEGEIKQLDWKDEYVSQLMCASFLFDPNSLKTKQSHGWPNSLILTVQVDFCFLNCKLYLQCNECWNPDSFYHGNVAAVQARQHAECGDFLR